MGVYRRPPDEFEFVPTADAETWRGAFNGETDTERTEGLELLAAAIDYAFHPADEDADALSILEAAVLRAADYIARQPCTCTEEDGCDRCYALGRAFNKPLDR